MQSTANPIAGVDLYNIFIEEQVRQYSKITTSEAVTSSCVTTPSVLRFGYIYWKSFTYSRGMIVQKKLFDGYLNLNFYSYQRKRDVLRKLNCDQ